MKSESLGIAPIKTRRDYRRALEEIEDLMAAKRNTPEGDRLDVLVTLVAQETGASRHGRTFILHAHRRPLNRAAGLAARWQPGPC